MRQQEWIRLAETRIRRVLRIRRYASLRQLEKKISEQGPSHKRPQPTYVLAGLKNLLSRGEVVPERLANSLPTFFMPADFDDDDSDRRTYILDLYRRFQEFVNEKTLCGNALETVVDRAANLGQKHHVLGPVQAGQSFNGVTVEHEIDHLLLPKSYTGPQVLIEDKNMREWLNPSSEQVWSVIANALRFPNTIPALICRKMSFVAFRVFKEVGLLCWQVYDQYFDPSIESDLVPIRHKDGLGFSDVTTDLRPSEALIRFFSSVIPENSATSALQFEYHRNLLRRYAIDFRLDGTKNSLGKELPQSKRTALYNAFLRELRERRTSTVDELEEQDETTTRHDEEDES